MNHGVRISLLLSLCLAAGSLFAEGVRVQLHFDASAVITDDLVGGMPTAEVLNLSGGFISNVDLRPKVASQVGIARDVLQFGSLADGDIAVIRAPFHAHNGFMDGNQPTTWRLDYDRPDGEHRQLIFTLDKQP